MKTSTTKIAMRADDTCILYSTMASEKCLGF